MSCLTLYIDNNNVIELQGLTNSVTDAADTGATVTCTILDAGGNEVSGQAWPASMTHDAAGTYRATLDYDLVLVNARTYTAQVDAVGSGGEVARWVCPVVALNRC